MPKLVFGDSPIIKMSKKEIPYGTFKSILLHSGLEEDDFKKIKTK